MDVGNLVSCKKRGTQLRVYENRVFRRILGLKRDVVIGYWRKLHNEELRNLYSSPSIIRMIKSRRMRRAGHVAQGKRNSYTILVGKPEGEGPLGGPRCRWEDNMKVDLTEIGLSFMDLINLAQDSN
jgi:hypothetical protein